MNDEEQLDMQTVRSVNFKSGMVFQDAQGRIVACDRTAEDILTLTAEQLIGRTLLAALRQTIQEDELSSLAEKNYLTTDKLVMGNRRQTDEVVWLSLSSTALFEANATIPYGFATTIRDVTAQKQRQDNRLQPTRSQVILCVDDDDAGRYATCHVLRKAGFTVLEAATGNEALQLAAQQPDAIVLDVILPDINGIDVCRILKSDPATAAIPILHLSASRTTSHDKAKGLESGADGYLTKPAEWQELLATIRSLLRIRASEIVSRRSDEIARQRLTEIESIYANAPIGLCFIDNNLRFVRINSHLAEINGLPVSEHIGRRLGEVLPELADSVEPVCRRVIESGEALLNLEVRGTNRAQPGVERDWLVNYCPLTQSDGRVLGVNITVEEITERKRAEQALRTSEERFRSTFDLAAVGISHVGIDGQWLLVNRALCDIVGYTREELLGLAFQDITYPEDLEIEMAYMRRVLANEIQTYAMEKRYIRKDGSLVWIDLTVSLVRKPDGEPDYFIAAIQDVDGRKRLEIALQDANRRILTNWESMTDAYVILDREWRVTYANQAATDVYYRLANLEPDAFLGKSHWEIYPSLIGTEVEREYRRAISEQVAVHLEILYELTGDWFEAHAYPCETGLGIYFRDISDRKRAEIALQEANERFTLAATAVNGLIYDWDVRSDRIERTHALAAIVGYTIREAEPTGQWWQERIHPEDLEQLNSSEAWERFANESRYCSEYRVRHKDGHYVWVEDRGVAVKDAEGNIVRVVGSTIDISDRKRAEMALRESERRYESLARLSPVGIFRSDRNGNVTYVNDRCCEITGLSRENSFGLDGAKAIHPDDRARVMSEWLQAIANQLSFRAEYRYQHADGTIRWAIGETIAETDENGRVVGYIGPITDISDRKQAEAALQESEEKYRTLFETIDQGFCICEMMFDENGNPTDYRFLEINRIFEEMTGLERARGKTAKELVPNLEDFWIETYGRVALTGESIRFEDRSLAMNRWFDVNAFRIGDPSSRRFAVLFANITDRKQAEEALRTNEELLRLGTQVAGFAIAKFDYATNTVSLSPEAAALYGLPEDELVVTRSRIHDTFHPDEREEMERIIAGVLDPSGDGWFARDHRVVWRNGAVRWLSVRKQVFFDRKGKIARPNYAILAAIDITERKRVEEELRESEEFSRSIFNSSADCIKVLDVRGNLVSMNAPGMCMMEIDDFSGFVEKDWTLFWQDDAFIAARNAIAAAKANGIGRFQGFCPTAKGAPKWWDVIVTPIVDAQGRVTRLVSTSRDITERKQAEQQLQQQAEELSQLNEALTKTTAELVERNQELDRFTHTVSHDLKAPLRAIANLSVWIEEDLDGQLPEDSQRQMELLRSRVYRLEALIDGLLAYSRVGRTEVVTERVNVGELLTEILDSLAPPATMTITVQPDMPTLSTKKLLLSQVFSNLISNAIKHHSRPQGRIEISAKRKGNCYEFTVADDGMGIAPEYHERVFGIFQTLKSRDKQESTGIGLSIVKKIVEAEGGAIVLESDVGKGATFRFTWRDNTNEIRG